MNTCCAKLNIKSIWYYLFILIITSSFKELKWIYFLLQPVPIAIKFLFPQIVLLEGVGDCWTRSLIRYSTLVIRTVGIQTYPPLGVSSFQRQWRFYVCLLPIVPGRGLPYQFRSSLDTGWLFRLRSFLGIGLRSFQGPWGSSRRAGSTRSAGTYSFVTQPSSRSSCCSLPVSLVPFCTWTWRPSSLSRKSGHPPERLCTLPGSRTC